VKFLNLPRNRGIWILLGIGVPILSLILIAPLHIDDCVYHSMALDYVRYGRLPYIGSWDSNFPGIVGIHVLSIELFGTSDSAIRILDVILQLGFVIIFYRFLRNWLRDDVAVLAGLLYIFYYVSSEGYLYSQRDVYVIMSVVTSLYLIFRTETRGMVSLSIASLVAGYSVLIRPTSLLFLAIIALFIFVKERGRTGIARGLGASLLFVVFGLVPLALFIAFYSTIPHGLESFYSSTIRFNIDVYTKFNLPIRYFMYQLTRKWFFLPFAAFGLAAVLKGKANKWIEHFLGRDERVLYGSLFASSVLIILLQQKYLWYHFAPFYLLLCPLSALGIEYVVSGIRSNVYRIGVIAIACFLSSFITYNPDLVMVFCKSIVHGNDGIVAGYDLRYNDPNVGAIQERRVISYLERPENRTGTVEICSFEPALRLHLNRPSAGPYVLPTPIACGTDGGKLPTPLFTDYQVRWRRAYMDSLRILCPHFIVLARNTVFWYLHDPYRSYLHGLLGFDSLLSSSYRYDTSFGGYQLFCRGNDAN
jgi:hypothetical protein